MGSASITRMFKLEFTKDGISKLKIATGPWTMDNLMETAKRKKDYILRILSKNLR